MSSKEPCNFCSSVQKDNKYLQDIMETGVLYEVRVEYDTCPDCGTENRRIVWWKRNFKHGE